MRPSIVLKRADDPDVKSAMNAAIEREESDPGGKAPHGDSSEEEDEQLAEN